MINNIQIYNIIHFTDIHYC